jgi:hypothetical protein
LKVQNTLGIIFVNGDTSVKKIQNSECIDELEINLKKETYVLDTYYMSEKEFSKKVEELDGKRYEITSWDLQKNRANPESYTAIWKQFWSSENSAKKFPIRINPEINI